VPTAHESGRECPPLDFQQIEQRASASTLAPAAIGTTQRCAALTNADVRPFNVMLRHDYRGVV
jgi:hypothetical protein